MRRAILATAFTFVAGVPSALADDTLSSSPLAASMYDWSGAYAGVFAGLSNVRSRVTDIDGTEFHNNTGGTHSRSGTSGLVGGTVGYNWQKGSFVYGAELEAGYIFNDHFWAINEPGQSAPPAMLTEYGFYGMAAARLGYALDRVLIYGKFGATTARIRSAGGEFQGVGDPDDARWGFDSDEAGYGDKMRFGFAVGTGVEWAATDRWSVKGEYLYMNFGSKTYRGVDPTGGRFRFRDDLHTFKIGLNMHF